MFSDPAQREKIPDPNALATFTASRLDWRTLDKPDHRARHALICRLLRIRHSEIVPRLKGVAGNSGVAAVNEAQAIDLRWRLGDGTQLTMIANLGDTPCKVPFEPDGRVLFETEAGIAAQAAATALPGWSVAVLIDDTASQ